MNYDFSLDRKSTIVLGAGSLLLVLLVFLAGFLAGVSWRRDSLMAAMRQAPVTVAAAAPPSPEKARPAVAQPNAPTPVTPKPLAPSAAEPPPPAAPVKPAAEPVVPVQAAALPAAPAIPSSPEQSGVRLAIQVGSFLQKSNAEKLADQLKHSGYNPEIVLAGIGAKQWNIVRVGPYQDWDEATQIAAQLSREQTGPAVIRPIR